jgi:hypothetical protein
LLSVASVSPGCRGSKCKESNPYDTTLRAMPVDVQFRDDGGMEINAAENGQGD